MHHADGHDVGQFQRGIGVERAVGGGKRPHQSRNRLVSLQIVGHARTIMDAEIGIAGRVEQARIPADRQVVPLDRGMAVGEQRGQLGQRVGELHLDILHVDAAADGEVVAQLIGGRGLYIIGFQVGVQRIIPAEIAFVIIQLQTEGGVDAQAKPEPVADLCGGIEAGNGNDFGKRVAAIIAGDRHRYRQARHGTARPAIALLGGRRQDDAANRRLDARQLSHGRWVEIDGRWIIACRRTTRQGTPGFLGRLFLKIEAARQRRDRGCQHA